MATAKQIQNFISIIAPLIQKYAAVYGYKVASPIIAQACLESAYGTSQLASKYHNYFGMKTGSSWRGKSVNLSTKEEYTVGTLTTIKAGFRVYDNMEDGVKGYFDFIQAKRYANLKTATTAKEYLEMIKADGYATSSKYVQNNLTVVSKYNLEQYDKIEQPEEEKPTADTKIRYARVFNCCFLNCRQEANGKILGVFARDTMLILYKKNANGWYEVGGKDTKGQTITGFCSARYLKEV